jgi:hypothetical protein
LPTCLQLVDDDGKHIYSTPLHELLDCLYSHV